MRFNCLDANPQERGNFFCRLSFGDALQNLPLSKRELVQFWINVSRLFFCRDDASNLNPLPDSVPHRHRELIWRYLLARSSETSPYVPRSRCYTCRLADQNTESIRSKRSSLSSHS